MLSLSLCLVASVPTVGDHPVSAHEHWAFQPIVRPLIADRFSGNPVDYFIDHQIEQRGFVATDVADWRTLVRRATYDLHGLPPTLAQLSTHAEHFSKLLDRLLASPRYGERWARHWLDVARYSDAKDGVLMYGDARIRPFAYTYRDYVIRAFNQDLPFDQFIREQLAADQMKLPPGAPALAAMGLLTLGRMFDNNPHDVIDDQIDVVTRGFLGLTVSCARCHDHKFDPLPTADYYSLYGVFASSSEPYDRPQIERASPDGAAYEVELRKKLDEVFAVRRKHYEQTLKTARERTPDYLVQVATTEPDISETAIFFLSLLPEQLRPQITYRWRTLIARRATPHDPIFAPWHDLMREPALRLDHWRSLGVDQRIIDGLGKAGPTTPRQVAQAYGEIIRSAWEGRQQRPAAQAGVDDLAALLDSEESPVWFPIHQIYLYLSRKDKDAFRGLVNQLDAISVKHKAAAARAMVMVDSESVHEPVIFLRGDPTLRGPSVPRQFLAVASGSNRQPFRRGSGRLDLAEAIASPDNPLTARVWVNRVWMHHFGNGLVETPSDFGLRTPRPLHHELLDYLASSLIEHGWRTKPLHRLIMSSRAYQRSSEVETSDRMSRQLEIDPTNRLLWRGNRRRLDLEQMRDTLLQLAGELDHTMYGRPQLITEHSNHRRTVYSFVERQNIPNIVQIFDFANADSSTARRTTTTVPQQALYAMNSILFTRAANAVARRSNGGSDQRRVARLYEHIFGRQPTGEEISLGAAFVKTSPWEQYAQILLMTNELMFVD